MIDDNVFLSVIRHLVFLRLPGDARSPSAVLHWLLGGLVEVGIEGGDE